MIFVSLCGDGDESVLMTDILPYLRVWITPAEGATLSTLLMLTSALQPSAEVLPGLGLLSHQVRVLPAEGAALLEAPEADLLLVDGRQELAQTRDLCRLIRTTGSDVPVILIVTEGGL